MKEAREALGGDLFLKTEKAVTLAIDVVEKHEGLEMAEMIEEAIYESFIEIVRSLMLLGMPTTTGKELEN